ncbi:MAG: hypothetical protein R2800_03940 [Flavipsychrobacter sp.]
MKFVCSLLLLLPFLNTQASTVDSIKIEDNYLLYHKVDTKQSEKAGLILYMHGGVSQFKGTKPTLVPTVDLLEGNQYFLPAATNAGYDVILPIAYNEYNWLEDKGELYINQIVATYGKDYERIIISGFSDGGTGAYRFFYNNPKQYAGLLLFNGYPQLGNYYKKVNHYDGMGKTIVYSSCTNDKVIPYEFLLVEYRRQSMLNQHTYFILAEGKHSFAAYDQQHIDQCIALLKKEPTPQTNDKITLYPPVDGLVVDGVLKHIYDFRKKTAKNYTMAATEYQNNQHIYKAYDKLLSNGAIIKLQPITVAPSSIKEGIDFDFDITIDGKKEIINLTNWLNTPTW